MALFTHTHVAVPVEIKHYSVASFDHVITFKVLSEGVYSVRGSMTLSLKSTSSKPVTAVSEEPHVFSLHQRMAGPV